MIENTITPRMQKEKILEYMKIMQDEEVPDMLRKIYAKRCEVILMHYKGQDYNALMDSYLIASACLKDRGKK